MRRTVNPNTSGYKRDILRASDVSNASKRIKLALPCKECTKAYTTKRESKFAHYCDALRAFGMSNASKRIKLALPCKECTKAYTTKRENKFGHYCDAFHASRFTSRRLNHLRHTTSGSSIFRHKFYLLTPLHRVLRQDRGLWERRYNHF